MAQFNPDAFLEATAQFDPESFLRNTGSQTQAPEISPMQSANLGAQQGLTLGFSDEAGAGGQAGLDKLQQLLNQYTGLVSPSPTQVSAQLAQQGFTGDIGPTDPQEMYQQEIARQRAELKQAEEQNPGSYLSGNLAGAALIPGGNIGTPASLLGKVAKGAATGITAGSIAGAGTSEAQNSEDLLADIGAGATIGGGVGGGLPIAGAGLKAIGKAGKGIAKFVGEIPFAKGMKESFEAGLANEPLYSEAGRKQAGRMLRDEASGYVKSLKDLQKKVGSEIQNEIETATEAGTTIDATKLLNNTKAELNDFIQRADDPKEKNEARKLLRIIKNRLGEKENLDNVLDTTKGPEGLIPEMTEKAADVEAHLTPAEAQQLKQAVAKYSPSGSTAFTGFEPAGKAMQLSKDLGEEVSNVTENLPELNSQYNNIKKIFERLKLTGKELPEEAVDKVSNTIANLENGSMAGDKASAMIKDTLGYLKNVDPDLATKFEPQLQKAARRVELATKATEAATITSPLGTIFSKSLQGANLAGLGARRVVEADPAKLVTLARNVAKVGQAGAEAARVINKAIEKDEMGRKALLFGLMQNPAYREAINKLEGNDGSEE